MDTQRARTRYGVQGAWIALLLLLFLTSNADAQRWQPGRLMLARYDSLLYFGYLDVDSLLLRNSMLQRLLDSTASTIGTSTARGEIQFTGVVNFANQANDSTNLQVDGNVYHAHHLLYDMYLDRAMIGTAKPGATSPSTWRDDLPPVTSDSVLIFRLSRNASFAAGARIGLTVYKVAKGTGLAFVNTAGTFYDMIRFDEAIMNTAGTSTQVLTQISLKKRR